MPPPWLRRTLFWLVCVGCIGTPVLAEADPEGFWNGAIVISAEASIDVAIEFKDGGEKGWGAFVYVPAQGIRDFPMIDVSVEGTQVGMSIPEVPGDPRFSGALSEDGMSIEGEYSQGGQTLKFQLTRGEKPAELKADPYEAFERPGVAGEGLAGSWKGVLQAGPHRMRLQLEIKSSESGELSGSLSSLDQGGQVMPVDGFTIEAAAVGFKVSVAGVEYSGSMSADGAEIAGSWQQAGGEMPLNFRRQP